MQERKLAAAGSLQFDVNACQASDVPATWEWCRLKVANAFDLMPKLPSGLCFALGPIKEEKVFSGVKRITRIHVIGSSRKTSDLYAALPVIRFGSALNPLGVPAEMAVPGGFPADTIAYDTNLSFLEFFESLNETDKKFAAEWIEEPPQQQFLSEQLSWVVRHRQTSAGEHILYSSRSRPRMSVEMREIYYPADLAVRVAGLFPLNTEDWRPYSSDAGYLRLRGTVSSGIFGPEGTLALGNPPSLRDIEAWEASKPAGMLDYWSFLAFATIPRAGGEQRRLQVFFEENTFFDRPLETIFHLDIDSPYPKRDEKSCALTDEISSELERDWELITRAISHKIGTASLVDQIWTIGGRKFHAHAPDA